LLPGDTSKAIDNTCVPGDFSALNTRVGVLGLEEELDALDGSDGGLGEGACGTTGREIHDEAVWVGFLGCWDDEWSRGVGSCWEGGGGGGGRGGGGGETGLEEAGHACLLVH